MFVYVPFNMKRLVFLRFAPFALTIVSAESRVAYIASEYSTVVSQEKKTLASNSNEI